MHRSVARSLTNLSSAVLLVALVASLTACGESATVELEGDAGPDGTVMLDGSVCLAGTQDEDGDGVCAAACAVSTCSGHGVCDDTSGAAVCTCDTGFEGASCASCASGFQDADGNGTCLPDCTGNDCSGNGTCAIVDGAATCACTGLHGGESCEDVCTATELAIASAKAETKDNDASELIDGLETGHADFTCGITPAPSFCTFEGDCSAGGCIQDATITLDLGNTQSFARLRFLSDFHTKRPRSYTIWVSDDPAIGPANGATLVHTGVGHEAPRVCETGDSCAGEDVPDACCPDGRSAPQDTRDVGDLYALYDIADFPEATGRYVYFVAEDAYFARELLMFEIELFDVSCP